MNINFRNFNLEIFGSSHEREIGVVIKNIPKGICIDTKYISDMMERRRPGKNKSVSPRNEPDKVIIKSGVENNYTNGKDIIGIIKNTNVRSKDYSKLQYTPRPSHADLTAYIKYKGKLDMKGGGPFSGRLTAPMVFAGAIIKKHMEDKGIYIVSHIKNVGHFFDNQLNYIEFNKKEKENILNNKLPLINSEKADDIVNYLESIRKQLDSIGSSIETVIYNVKAGLGEHSDYSLESMISKTMFCIPGIKGIDFGKGFGLIQMKGSNSNDGIYYDKNKSIKTKSNNMGGILGGISNGMPIVFSLAMKPTPSIGKKQQTINLETKENVTIEIKGRHDPCIGIRAVPVVEALSSLVIFDYILEIDKNEKS